MATSIGKLSKSFFLKLLVGIIILPFVFWGMGDVFRGGNQNVVATVDSNKISTQEFINYINRLNLNEEQVKNLSKTDLVEQILSDFIGKKVLGRVPKNHEQPNILQDYANTSSAGSIIAFSLFSEDMNKNEIGVLCSFGAGYSAGSIILKKIS